MEKTSENGKPPCRTCTDFKTWSQSNKAKTASNQSEATPQNVPQMNDASHKNCPVDKDELGRSTWKLLHTVAAYYPDQPTDTDKKRVDDFFRNIALMYPCEVCAEDFQRQIERFPPKTESQDSLSQWLCRAHNRINMRTGKAFFDCSKVNERWRDGWKDGSCD